MAYIGLPPKANFTSGLLDRFTSTTGTTVTLTNDISSENDIVVFVNFVKQDSTTYSVGGTGNKTLTLGGTLVSSDIVEVHYLNIVGQTVAPSSGSVGSSQLTADVITGQTALAVAPDSTDELLISDAGVLKRVDVSLVGGNNTPSFEAYQSATQSGVGDAVWTKITMNTEAFDTNSEYDNSSNYRFTPQTAGKYFVYVMGAGLSDTSYKLNVFNIAIYKNGSAYRQTNTTVNGADRLNEHNAVCTAVIDMNGSSDYVEAYARVNVTTGTGSIDARSSSGGFGAYKIIE